MADDGEPASKRQKPDSYEEPVEAEEPNAGEEDGALLFSPEEQEALERLQGIQQRIEEVHEEASQKVLAIEQEYDKKRRPMYTERSSVISLLPGFWHRVFANCKEIAGLLTNDDLSILQFCTEMDVEHNEDVKSGFTITFRFPENPFFTDTELRKVYSFVDDGSSASTTLGTSPQWNEGMAPTEGRYGLFSWISEQLELQEATADPIADIIKEAIWLDPLRYYVEQDDAYYGNGEEYEVLPPEGALLEETDGDAGALEGGVMEEGGEPFLEGGEGEEGGEYMDGAEGADFTAPVEGEEGAVFEEGGEFVDAVGGGGAEEGGAS